MDVRAAIAWARAQGLDRLDAQLLLAQALGRPRSWLIAHDDQVLDGPQQGTFTAAVLRRAAGEPLAYLTGEREFRGLSLAVGPAVLVPRPETEHLVDWALERLAGRQRPRVLDLGTGSGAIALAIAHERPDAAVHASDLSAEALAVARSNAQRCGLKVQFRQGPWWQPWAGQRFDLVVSNPPYIAGADPHLAALRHEPELALTPGGDGLGALQAIAAAAAAHLEPGAWLLLEHGFDQAVAVRALLAAAGLADPETRPDLAGLDRCTGARMPPLP